MTIVRPQMMLTLAIGLLASGPMIDSVFAGGAQGAAGHDHETMKAEKKISDSLASLSAMDREQAEAQRFCPMMAYGRLGAMGKPVKVVIEGRPVFVCCKGCVDDAKNGGAATLETAQKLAKASETLAKLSVEQRASVEGQKFCAVANNSFLGSMGVPVKLEIDGQPVYLCCKGCAKKAQANPAATLARVEQLRKAGVKSGHDHGHHNH